MRLIVQLGFSLALTDHRGIRIGAGGKALVDHVLTRSTSRWIVFGLFFFLLFSLLQTGLKLSVRRIQISFEPLRSEEHTSELQSLAYLVCRLLLEKKKELKARETSLRDRIAAF